MKKQYNKLSSSLFVCGWVLSYPQIKLSSQCYPQGNELTNKTAIITNTKKRITWFHHDIILKFCVLMCRKFIRGLNNEITDIT
jgi:hypothetical protein